MMNMPDVIAEPVIVVDVDMKQGLGKAKKQLQSTFSKMGSMLSNFYVRVGKSGPRAGWSGINPMKMMGGGQGGGGGEGVGSAGLGKMAVGLGLTAILGAVLIGVKKLAQIVKNTEVFKFLRTLFQGFIGSMLGFVVMLLYAITFIPNSIIKGLNEFKDHFVKAWDDAVEFVDGIIAGFTDFVDDFKERFLKALDDVAQLIGEILQPVIDGVIDLIDGAIVLFKDAISVISTTFDTILGGLKTAWDTSLGLLKGVWDMTFGKLIELWNKTFGRLYGRASTGSSTPEGTYAGVAGVATVGAGISQELITLLNWTRDILSRGPGGTAGLSAVEKVMLRKGIDLGIRLGSWSADEVERNTATGV